MKVLAIDPGFGRCGVAIIEGAGAKASLIYSTCIETSTRSTFAERLLVIGEAITKLLDEQRPDLVALEELYFSNNAKTAIRVAETRGMLLYIAASRGAPVSEFNPQAVKIAVTGYGRSGKEQVTSMTRRLINLPKRKMLDDEYDAIALGLTALASAKYNEARKQPPRL